MSNQKVIQRISDIENITNTINSNIQTLNTTATNTYNIVNNSTYGNSAIKSTLNTVNTNTTNAYNIVNNSTYGNSALNTKLTNTYNIVNNSSYGNSAIKTALNTANSTLNTVSTNTSNIYNGISDLKTDTTNINNSINTINSNADKIYNIVNDSTNGNSAIMDKLDEVNTTLTSGGNNSSVRWIDNSKISNFKTSSPKAPENVTIVTGSDFLKNPDAYLTTLLSVNGKGRFFGLTSDCLYRKNYGLNDYYDIIKLTIDEKVVSYMALCLKTSLYGYFGIIPIDSERIISSKYYNYLHIHFPGISEFIPLSNELAPYDCRTIYKSTKDALSDKMKYYSTPYFAYNSYSSNNNLFNPILAFEYITEPITFNESFKLESYIISTSDGGVFSSSLYEPGFNGFRYFRVSYQLD